MMSPKLTPDQSVKKSQAYADAIPDDEAPDSAYEPVYRDGSAVSECWDRRGYGSQGEDD